MKNVFKSIFQASWRDVRTLKKELSNLALVPAIPSGMVWENSPHISAEPVFRPPPSPLSGFLIVFIVCSYNHVLKCWCVFNRSSAIYMVHVYCSVYSAHVWVFPDGDLDFVYNLLMFFKYRLIKYFLHLQIIPSTQDVGVDDFEQGAWRTMLSELGDNDVVTSYNIATVLRKVSLISVS